MLFLFYLQLLVLLFLPKNILKGLSLLQCNHITYALITLVLSSLLLAFLWSLEFNCIVSLWFYLSSCLAFFSRSRLMKLKVHVQRDVLTVLDVVLHLLILPALLVRTHLSQIYTEFTQLLQMGYTFDVGLRYFCNFRFF